MRPSRLSVVTVLTLALASVWAPIPASAQTVPAQTVPNPPGPTPAAQSVTGSDDVAAAAAAYQQGQRAQLVRDWARAADLFELADRAAPSPAALRSAIRSHQAAGHPARAASLALRARARDAADPQSAALAQTVLTELTPQMERLAVRCVQPCELTVDRQAVSFAPAAVQELFVEPGAHTVEVRWAGHAARQRTLSAEAGRSSELLFDPPDEPSAPAPVPTPAPVPGGTVPVESAVPSSGTLPPVDDLRRPLSPAVFITGAVLTVGAAVVLAWSGVDTLAARDAYVASPTESGYTDGASRELRTDLLVATVGVLGVATAVTGLFFTDWGPRGTRGPTGQAGRVRGTFGLAGGGAASGVVVSF